MSLADARAGHLHWKSKTLDDQICRQAAHWTEGGNKKTSVTPNPIPIPDKLAIGEKLQQIRKRRGLSQVELAKRLGLHQSLISQYERGHLRLHGGLIVRLAAALGVTPDTFLASALGNGTLPEAPVDWRFLRRLQKINMPCSYEKKVLLGTIAVFLARVS